MTWVPRGTVAGITLLSAALTALSGPGRWSGLAVTRG